jgi:2-aminoethylphosphonate-pyruvate transaminase
MIAGPFARKDKLLFTPGPLTTSRTVKEAMLHDLGSRDGEFIAVVRDIRSRLLSLAEGAEGHEAVLLQGSGTYALEAVLGSAIPADGKLLVAVNGSYGRRLVEMARVLRISVAAVECGEDEHPDLGRVERAMVADPAITHLAAVHCETTSGIVNPAASLGPLASRRGVAFVLDAMSSFGALPIDLAAWKVDFLVSSANKCIEGVPGFAFVLARRPALLAAQGQARSLSLDLHAQWNGLEADGQFRFTPPTHALLAFQQALRELEAEGGVVARGARYRRCQRTLAEGMGALGFAAYLPPARQGPIITSFRSPAHPAFAFAPFAERLAARGFVIYPGKVSRADCFRIGTIGHLAEGDVHALLEAIGEVLVELGVPVPVPAQARAGGQR